jgi:hypothetical protein
LTPAASGADATATAVADEIPLAPGVTVPARTPAPPGPASPKN